MDGIEQFFREVLDLLVPRVTNGEEKWLNAQTLELQDLAHTEGLCEGREALENVGQMSHPVMVAEVRPISSLHLGAC